MSLRPKKLNVAPSDTASITPISGDIEEADRILSIVKFMNYNIACNNKRTRDSTETDRIECIVKIIKEADGDVVALHNVDSSAFMILNSMLEQRYMIFQVFTDEKDLYGDVLLFHKDRISIPDGSQPYYYDFKNGRIIGTEIQTRPANGIEPHRFHVLTTTLDSSIDGENIRSDQFDTVLRVTKTLQHFIILGEFNICDINEPIERQLFKSQLSDAWIKLGCPELLRSCVGHLRSTRVYYQLPGSIWLNSQIASGLDRIKDINITPSPYAALTTVFCEEN